MTVIATATPRYSNLVKFEQWVEKGYCKKVVTVNQAAATLGVGAVLGSYIASPTATSAAAAGNTGNGAMGAITVTSGANLVTGVYKLRISQAAANAGNFAVYSPTGAFVGSGTVGVAFSQGGLSFTLADGATDFVVGDTLDITVAGTVKYKLVEATATDGTEVARAVVVGNSQGAPSDVAVAANTDTSFLVIYRGPVMVAHSALVPGASVNTVAEIAAMHAQLTAVGIDVLTAI